MMAGMRCQEALAIHLEDISWPDRSIVIHGKGGHPREMFFSLAVGCCSSNISSLAGSLRSGPLFVPHRKARRPRRADLTPDGYARLSYRQADTPVEAIHTGLGSGTNSAIPRSASRAAHDYTEVDLKSLNGHTSLRSLERYIADTREAA